MKLFALSLLTATESGTPEQIFGAPQHPETHADASVR